MINNIKGFCEILKQIWDILSKKQRRKCGSVFFIIIVASFLELLGVSSIIPFVSVLIDIDQFRTNPYVAPILDWLNIQSEYGIILAVGLLLIGIYLAKNAVLLFLAYVQIDFRCKLQKELSVQMLRSYMVRPYTFFVNVNSAEILRGIGSDIGSVFFVVDDIFTLLSQILTFSMIGIFLVVTDWEMAVGIIIVAVLCMLFIVLFMKNKMIRAGQLFREADIKKTKIAVEAVNGIKEITVLRRKQYFVEQYDQAYEKLRQSDKIKCFLSRVPERIVETFFICGILITVCIRAQNVEDMSSLVTVLSAFALSAIRILPSISSISNSFNNLSYQKPSLNHAYDNIVQARKQDSQGEFNDETVEQFHSFENKFELKNIFWKYDKAKEPVLEGLDLTINKGEAIAFIGESGSGKTTLADVILGLLHPREGTVTVDGVNIYDIPQNWSRMIGYVPQTVYLTDDTIRANVALGFSKENCDEKAIWDALEQAQLKEFVETLPEGLDTIVGEHGVKFSGGQRQRIAIARALYYNPDILVLDEATSALDNETEMAVMEAIDALQGQKTLIIVAHRLSTIKNCDKIYEIKDGKAILREKSEIFKET